jgi:hypothetical protein
MSRELTKEEIEDIEHLQKNLFKTLKIPLHLHGLKEDDVVGMKSLEIMKQKTRKKMYAVYEKEPAHGSQKDSIIMGPYKTKEEAKEVGEKYGYHGDNYYVDIIK